MTLPNFLVIGAAKGGTTSLTPVKETNFFWTEAREHGRKTVQTLAQYERLFDAVKNESAVGEISPQYLNSVTAAERIRRDLPDVCLIVSLRSPADRAWSDYLGRFRILRESGPFENAIQPGQPCFESGLYFQRLKRYYDRFPRERMHVMLYEDLAADPQACLREVFAFLDVDPDVQIDTSIRHNAAARPRSVLLNRVLWKSAVAAASVIPARWRGTGILERLLSKTYRPASKLAPEMRRQLVERYYEDIIATSELIGRDLSRWLE